MSGGAEVGMTVSSVVAEAVERTVEKVHLTPSTAFIGQGVIYILYHCYHSFYTQENMLSMLRPRMTVVM